MTALISGEVDFQFAEALLVAPQMRAGKAASARHHDIAAVRAVPGFTDAECIAARIRSRQLVCAVRAGRHARGDHRHDAAVRQALEAKPVRALFEQDAIISAGSSPEELGVHLKREIDRYAKVIRKGNITAQ